MRLCQENETSEANHCVRNSPELTPCMVIHMHSVPLSALPLSASGKACSHVTL